MSEFFEEQPSMPPNQAVISAYKDVSRHNARYTSLGTVFLDVVNTLIEDPEYIDESTTPGSKKSAQELHDRTNSTIAEGDMDGDLQDILHGSVFEGIGIKLQPQGSTIKRLDPDSLEPSQAVTSERLGPVVVDAELFANYIRTIETESTVEDDTELSLIRDVLQGMANTVRICYSDTDSMDELAPESLEEIGEETLRSFIVIDNALTTQGLDRPAQYVEALEAGRGDRFNERWEKYTRAQRYIEAHEEIAQYVEHWGRGVLREHIQIGPLYKLEQPRLRFFDGLQHELTQEVAYVKKMMQNERTAFYGTEVSLALLTGYEALLEEAEQKPSAWWATDTNIKLILNAIDTLKTS